MSSKTALVTGATGLLGRQVVRAFERKQWDVKGTGYSRADGSQILKVDLANESEIESTLDTVKPQVVIHCAANRFPDKCDADPSAARALNVAATGTLASRCAARDVLLIYISTDYVFAGRPGEAPYEADATPGPTNLYGETKLDGERAVISEYGKGEGKGKEGLGVVLRVPVLYGDAEVPGESAVNVLLDTVWKAQQQQQGIEGGDGGTQEKIKMDHWAKRYPTNTEDVGRVCHDIAQKYLSTPAASRASLPPILQFTSEDQFTKYEICQLLAEIMGLPIAGIEPNTQGNEPGAAVQRPYDTHLSTRALRDLGINVSAMDFVGWWRWHVRAFRK
ncbi:putative methionine adenosyltransferase 2 subunit beta protein [Eutypa lata UCREL1]|uniref:Putative methionine adenosyltransferase 2 subunit beta protein n=1 Tax=Eutypa lata (strain UCR-EL1) TaxID=1287681 RepID=M7T6R7_EUTLA|nr:putative methionine adenosyltransferase 2 subunit beta protein [Eutypa lata UCREL1]